MPSRSLRRRWLRPRRTRTPEDAEVRATLATIERDEGRHAALGWQTLRWALAGADAVTRATLRARFDATLAHPKAEALRGAAKSDAEPALEAHGKLSSARRSRLVLDGLDEVVVSVAASLWASRVALDGQAACDRSARAGGGFRRTGFDVQPSR